MKKNLIVHYIIIIVILAFLFIPLLATFVFSIASKWEATILPEGLSLTWYSTIFKDPRFISSAARSLLVCTITVVLSLVIMIPTVFSVVVYKPRLEKYLNIITTIPFAIPGVVFAVGLLNFYSKKPFMLTGTIWILVGAYFIIVLPYTFQSIRNSLRVINAKQLMDSAEILHASKFQAFIRVVLPNISKGVISSALLSFSILFGEFVLTNLLAGGQFETVQIYLYSKRAESGHITSAIVISYFVVILILSIIILKIGSSRKERKIEENL
ncbi:ABC transporter permease [Clostridium akagii]|uniref:ABC transporter permease n=1 Tax=Clostridium akagii TaxID=91623 RepID=UPI00047CD6C5|nr:ABC transporter permease [Clostridium akagii]